MASPVSIARSISINNSVSGLAMSPSPRAHSVTSLPAHSERRAMQYDEHMVDVDELERRLTTDRQTGLSPHVVSQLQSENPQRLNLLPIDAEVGHGGIHELVGVLRDGSWIHTRAENLLPGDVIALKEGRCVPADVRLIECQDMWVDQSVLLGKRDSEPRAATTNSVFDEAEANVPYMEALNVAFYGTMVTRGQGKAIVIRTGEDTVLGTISSALLQKKKDDGKRGEVPLTESMKQQFEDVFCTNDSLPPAINRISALVVEHSEVVKRTVISASFGANPTVIIELEDLVVANETSSEELEREIALQMMNYCQSSEDAAVFTKALAACRHRVEGASFFGGQGGIASSSSDSSAGGGAGATSSTQRVPSLPASSPIAAPVVIDPIRDQNAILRFCAQFGMNSPRNVSAANRKMRYSTLLHAQISGCEVYVHFDQECGAHVVLLQGPAREILSRCGKVRRDGTAIMSALETADLQKIQDMVMDLEARNETVVSFAELYLDPEIYPVGVKFDIENFNFPTSNMCYLGSLGLIEKLQPEVVLMGSFARAADVRLLIPTVDREYPDDNAPYLVEYEDDIVQEDEDDIDEDDAGGRVRCVCKIPVRLREASTGEVIDLDACVFRSKVLSISNTLSQWRQILSQHSIVIFDGCSPAQVDLLVETLQELGECVGLVASGSANALAISSADVGFAIPAQEVIDLSEEAADVVLSSATCPRSDAIRLIEAAKKTALSNSTPTGTTAMRGGDSAALRVAPLPNLTKAKSVVVNLLRESIFAGKMLGLSESDIKVCFEAAISEILPTPLTSSAGNGVLASPSSNPAAVSNLMFPPLSPPKFPPSAFRSTGLVLSPDTDVVQASVSSSCLMYQDFKKPPLCSALDGDGGSDVSSGEESESGRQSRGPHRRSKTLEQEKPVLPFHRFIAKPDWPLDFETSASRKVKSCNALLSGDQVAISSQLLNRMLKAPPSIPEKLKLDDKHALIKTLVAPAVFGESAFLDQDHQQSKCSIVADCIVETLLFDHLRLQEMDLASEVIHEISEHAPKCLNEKQVVKQQTEKKHLRLLSNGCSIMMAGRQERANQHEPQRRPQSNQGA